MAYYAKVIADSINNDGDRLITLEVCFPRFILAEFNTHRMFSRNSASSRAIPVAKQLERIMDDPFIPEYWGAAQAGMQAENTIPKETIEEARRIWLDTRDGVVEQVKHLLALGLHKQIANRPLEPFMWHTVIVTATDWRNFFALRDNKNAQPEIQKIAKLMLEAIKHSTPRKLHTDEWHMPYIQDEERDGTFETSEKARQISAARCARVSYLTHDKQRDLDADLTLYARLMEGGHMSPFEHVARPLTAAEQKKTKRWGNFKGWMQLRKVLPGEHDFSIASSRNIPELDLG